MQITFLTLLWSLIGLLSIIGLFSFNSDEGFFNFITSRKYLLLIIVAALFGMREHNWLGLFLLGLTLSIMYLDYKLNIEDLKHLKL